MNVGSAGSFVFSFLKGLIWLAIDVMLVIGLVISPLCPRHTVSLTLRFTFHATFNATFLNIDVLWTREVQCNNSNM